jgi:protein-S-isoprenylcysteine O-methyltransferase Ste14
MTFEMFDETTHSQAAYHVRRNLARGRQMVLFLKNLIFTLLVPGTVAVYVPWRLIRDHQVIPGVGLVVGALLLAIGAGIYGWCIWDFATFGRGTPAPIDAPRHLVVRGLYRYVRNPMYLGVLTTISGFTVLFRSKEVLVYGLGTWVCFHLFVLLYEEPHLRKVFGGEYADYCERVRRWLPRFHRS